MRVAYVIPVYNCCGFLYQTIESILPQADEIVVVDDASTDDICYLKDYFAGCDKVRWITNNKRMGAAYCRNLGNSVTTSEIVSVCDAGDFVDKDRSKRIKEYFSVHKEKHIFYSDVNVVNALGEVLYTQKAIGWAGNSKPPISHPTVAFKREILEEVHYHEGCLDTDFYEFFLLDAYVKGCDFGFLNKVTYYKMDMTNSYHHRDVKKAKDEKYKKYLNYNINIKRGEV